MAKILLKNILKNSLNRTKKLNIQGEAEKVSVSVNFIINKLLKSLYSIVFDRCYLPL